MLWIRAALPTEILFCWAWVSSPASWVKVWLRMEALAEAFCRAVSTWLVRSAWRRLARWVSLSSTEMRMAEEMLSR